MSRIAAKALEDRPMFGISLILAAYLAFAGIDTNAKWLGLLGVPALQLAFMRYFGHFAIATSLILKGGWSADRFSTSHFGLVFVRATLLMLSTIFNFIAVQHIPLTLTSTILFSSPIIICALSGPLLGERVGIWRWSAILIGFVGILIAVRPFDASFHWAALLSISGAVCFAFYAILTRHLSGKVSTESMQFYSGLVGTLVLLPFAVLQWESPSGVVPWFSLAMLGFFGWLGHNWLTMAHVYANSSTLMPFGYTFILYLTLASWLLFDQPPDMWTAIGAVIIIAAGLFIWLRERQLNRERRMVPQ